MRTLLVPKGHDLREPVEDLISGIYTQQYCADVREFPPLLLAMCAGNGTPVCAAGLRFAADGFFSECYLDEPVEDVLFDICGDDVDRESIFEVSCLVTCAPALAPRFLAQIVTFGDKAGFEWAFFTATSNLKNLLKRLRLPMLEIGVADRSRVNRPQAWGSYYDTDPRLYAVHQKTLSAFFAGPTQRPMHA